MPSEWKMPCANCGGRFGVELTSGYCVHCRKVAGTPEFDKRRKFAEKLRSLGKRWE